MNPNWGTFCKTTSLEPKDVNAKEDHLYIPPSKKKLRNYSNLKESKEAWQQNNVAKTK